MGFDLYQPRVLTRGLASIGLHIEIIGNLADDIGFYPRIETGALSSNVST
jgi:hypothetical protein